MLELQAVQSILSLDYWLRFFLNALSQISISIFRPRGSCYDPHDQWFDNQYNECAIFHRYWGLKSLARNFLASKFFDIRFFKLQIFKLFKIIFIYLFNNDSILTVHAMQRKRNCSGLVVYIFLNFELLYLRYFSQFLFQGWFPSSKINTIGWFMANQICK